MNDALTPQQTFSNDTARSLVDLWQVRLGLSEWDVRCVFVHDTSLEEGGFATIEHGREPLVAILVLAVSRPESDLEDTIIGQLLRLKDPAAAKASN